MANGKSGPCVLDYPPAKKGSYTLQTITFTLLSAPSNPFSGGSVSWVPLRIPSTVARPSNAAVPEIITSTDTGHASRLLLVEDNVINQKVAKLMLKHLGYNADIVNNGIEAVEAVARHSYDLVFMDCLMPEMDGLEATRVIRARGDYGATVPIIAMTANAYAEDRQACLAAGMSDYLSKPIREAELAAKLKQWLGRDRG